MYKHNYPYFSPLSLVRSAAEQPAAGTGVGAGVATGVGTGVGTSVGTGGHRRCPMPE